MFYLKIYVPCVKWQAIFQAKNYESRIRKWIHESQESEKSRISETAQIACQHLLGLKIGFGRDRTFLNLIKKVETQKYVLDSTFEEIFIAYFDITFDPFLVNKGFSVGWFHQETNGSLLSFRCMKVEQVFVLDLLTQLAQSKKIKFK